jgi:hypothetical protein
MTVRRLLSPLAIATAGLLGATGLLVAGCSLADIGDDDDDVDDDDAIDDDDAVDDDDDVPEFTGSLVGTIVDPDGNAVTDFKVTLCAEVCRDTDSDATGTFTFTNIGPNLYILENLFSPNGDPTTEWSRFFTFVDIGENEEVTLPTALVVPRVDGTADDLTGAQDIDTTTGLTGVKFDADSVDPSPFHLDAVAFGAAVIPEAEWPAPGVGMPADYMIHGAWALSVWDQSLVDGFQATATLDTSIPDGRTPIWLTADYDLAIENGMWHEDPAQFDGDERNIVMTTEADGLDRTTMWIVASKPE